MPPPAPAGAASAPAPASTEQRRAAAPLRLVQARHHAPRLICSCACVGGWMQTQTAVGRPDFSRIARKYENLFVQRRKVTANRALMCEVSTAPSAVIYSPGKEKSWWGETPICLVSTFFLLPRAAGRQAEAVCSAEGSSLPPAPCRGAGGARAARGRRRSAASRAERCLGRVGPQESEGAATGPPANCQGLITARFPSREAEMQLGESAVCRLGLTAGSAGVSWQLRQSHQVGVRSLLVLSWMFLPGTSWSGSRRWQVPARPASRQGSARLS